MRGTSTSTSNGHVKITEPLTYRQRGDHSMFTDLLLRHRGSDEAKARLERHEKEMRDQLPTIERRGSSTQPEGVTFEREYRAPSGSFPSGTTPGGGGAATPPLWAVELEGVYPRPQRVIADLANPMPLPAGVSSVNVPILTTGTSTSQQTPNQPVSATDVTDTAGTSPVVTIAGQCDVPIQMIEQSPRGVWETTLLRDLWADFDAKFERMLINGTGGSAPTGQILGCLNVSGIGSVTYTDSSPTGPELFTKLGPAFASVSNNRKIRPEAWAMTGSRFAWLSTSEDSSSRPLEVPAAAQRLVDDPTMPTPVGSLVGLPIFTNEELPTTQGTGANQDLIMAFRWSDFLVWESEPTLNVFTQTISGDLMARVQFRCYVAAIMNRYPSGMSTITGSGLAVQSGF